MIRRLRHAAWLAVFLAACAPTAVQGVATSASPTGAAAPTPAPSRSPTPLKASAPLQQRQELSLLQPREELATATLDGTLFIIGGYDAAGRDTSSVFVYTGSWSPGPPLPQALDHPAAAVLGDQLYVSGGFSGGRATATTYRLAKDHWERVASLHHARAAMALIPLGGRLYALGGRDSSLASVATPEVYDPLVGTWSDLPAMPAPRHHVAGFDYQGMACVAGGKFPYTARIDCFDPGSRLWRRLPDLPQPTSGASAITLGNELIVTGGEGDAVVPWLFWFDGETWQRQPMLLPRHGMQLAVWMQRAWACGGGAVAGLHPTSLCTSIGLAAVKVMGSGAN
jgi:hypothetical protein